MSMFDDYDERDDIDYDYEYEHIDFEGLTEEEIDDIKERYELRQYLDSLQDDYKFAIGV